MPIQQPNIQGALVQIGKPLVFEFDAEVSAILAVD